MLIVRRPSAALLTVVTPFVRRPPNNKTNHVKQQPSRHKALNITPESRSHNNAMIKQIFWRKKVYKIYLLGQNHTKTTLYFKILSKKEFHFKSIFYICERKQAFWYFKIKLESGYS